MTVRGADRIIPGEVKVLRLEPGDEIVIRCEKKLSSDAIKALAAMAEERWPGHRVTVLEQSLELQLVRPVEQP